MVQHLLTLSISRVDEIVFTGEVVSVQVPGIDGEMQILANHEPLISPLKEGAIKIQTADGATEQHEIKTGTLEISQNHATILV